MTVDPTPSPGEDERRFSRRDLLRGRFLAGLVDLAARAVPKAKEALAGERSLPALLARVDHASRGGPRPPARPVPGATTAMIDPLLCLPYRGSPCTVCSERCPEPGAILIVSGRPRVDPRPCTGCAVCKDVCPAPTNAVRLLPRMGGAPPPRSGP